MTNITDKRARDIVRTWAIDNDYQISAKGAIPERIRQAYVETYGPEAVADIVEYVTSPAGTKMVIVMCPLCANLHTHSADSLGHRSPHCSDELASRKGGYWLGEKTS